jgi:hypothetical protein
VRGQVGGHESERGVAHAQLDCQAALVAPHARDAGGGLGRVDVGDGPNKEWV